MAVFSLPFVIFDGIAEAFQAERNYGTLSLLFVSPVNRLKIFLSRGAVQWANGIVALAASLVAAWAILGLDFSEVAWVSAFLLDPGVGSRVNRIRAVAGQRYYSIRAPRKYIPVCPTESCSYSAELSFPRRVCRRSCTRSAKSSQ